MTQDLNQENKRKKTVIVAIIAVVVIAIIAGVYIPGSSGRKLKKQLDLGYKFLTEQEYEQAIAIFKKAIEIDPMSVDAYLGLADAYVGKGDFETAKSTLEDAIKFFEENGQDTTVLKNKIEEIDRIEAERRAKEEEERLAALPFVALQPMIDACSNVWGRKWDEWTVEDFVEEFDVHTQTYETEFESPDGKYYTNGGSIREMFWSKTFINEDGIHTSLRTDAKIINITEQIHSYICTIVMPHGNEYFDMYGDLYSFAEENGINSIDTYISYLGLAGMINEGEEIEIRTDYGRATAVRKEKLFEINIREPHALYYCIQMGEIRNGDGELYIELYKLPDIFLEDR